MSGAPVLEIRSTRGNFATVRDRDKEKEILRRTNVNSTPFQKIGIPGSTGTYWVPYLSVSYVAVSTFLAAAACAWVRLL